MLFVSNALVVNTQKLDPSLAFKLINLSKIVSDTCLKTTKTHMLYRPDLYSYATAIMHCFDAEFFVLDIDAVHNEAIISIYPYADHEKTIQNYLFLLLPYASQYGESKNAIKGKTLNDTSISNLLIPLPPLAEQKRIVARIEELLPLIDRYEQAWSALEDFNARFPVDMQKSILQMAIQGKLVPQIPEEGTGEELFQQIQSEKQALIKAGKIKYLNFYLIITFLF